MITHHTLKYLLLVLTTALFIGCSKQEQQNISFSSLQDVAPWTYVRSVAVDGVGFLEYDDLYSNKVFVGKSEVSAELFAQFLNDTGYARNVPAIVAKWGVLYIKDSSTPISVESLTNVFIVDYADSNPVRSSAGLNYHVCTTGRVEASGVTFYGAQAFCRWYAMRTGIAWRLPRPEEWLGVANSLRDDLRGMPGGSLEWCDSSVQFGGSKKWAVMGGEWHMRRKMTRQGIAYQLPTLWHEHEQSIGFRVFGLKDEGKGAVTNSTKAVRAGHPSQSRSQ